VSETATEPKPAAERYDELRDQRGAIRSHWQPFVRALDAIAPEEYTRRHASARAMVRDNGVTYNVYDESAGRARPWQLDIVPFILGADDWAVIEAAVLQRARLTDAILADVYGSQKLVTEGHLPPHLVLGHPQFLRPLAGAKPAGGVHAHLYCADLARAADGSWRVMASRADAPGGLGYALENRIVVSQTFPDSFTDMGVARLASFFNAYRENIFSLGNSRRGRAVLLTPGPFNEAYFEHVYLAHYLGLTLVEGEDLAVRDGEVFLKTLTGLERVSAIFRRVDSDYCDPLEFRGDSALGVPGLAEAVRRGGVVLANALGGGVAESPALDAYLPAIARAVLGEDLKIPDIATIWCGTEWGRKAALARLGTGVLRDAFDARPLFSRNSSARLGHEMSAPERERAAARIAQRGETLVVQDFAPLGLAPVYENGAFRARPISLRVFAAWTREGWIVMPGGLTRVAADENIRALSMQSGAASKDAWILSGRPVDRFSLLNEPGKPVEVKRQGEAAPSRAMDNLFWLGRYAERSESLMRILRAVAARFGEDAQAAGGLMRNLVIPFARESETAVPQSPLHNEAEFFGEFQKLLYGRRHPYGLQRLLSRVESTAWAVRDRLSLDTWRTIHAFTESESIPAGDASFDAAGASFYLDTLVRRAAALSGLSAENMTRGPNWLFMDLGRRIERASHLAWLVRQTVCNVDTDEIERIRIVLEIADSAMTYRSRYLNAVQAVPFIDLLLLDEGNPRSCAFQLVAIQDHIRALPRVTLAQRGDLPSTIAARTRGLIGMTDANAMIRAEDEGRAALGALTDRVRQDLASLSDAIADAYFQHLSRRRISTARRELI
jgi:uncharacterized circularly permuted ATP-grasp superfamily protein/uncharacterized alpha-E superfamily protein